MKKTACLVLSTVVFAFMFSIVALVSPALAEVNQTQQATTLNSQGVSSTAVDDQSQNEQNAHSRSSIQATSVPKTSIANAQVSKQGMMRNVVSGREIKPTVVIKVSGKTLVEGKDYRLKFGSEYRVPTAAGTYSLVAEALESGSYSGSIKIGDYKLFSSPFKENIQYALSPVTNSNFMLDATGKRPNVGSNVTIWTRNNGANQMWYLKLGADGYYTIKSAANDRFILDAAASSPKVGSNVSIWSSKNQDNQKWIIEPSTNGSYIIRNAANPSLVLDAAGISPKCGANVSVWSAKSQNNNNQKWTIKTLNDVYTSLDSLAAQNKSVIADGTYVIYASAVGGNPVLDVKNGATNEGANIQLAASNASANQAWEISHSGNYVLIKNKRSGKYLSVASNNSLSGANVIQSANADVRGSKWIFLKNSDGSFSVRSALYTGISLDVQAGKSAAGTNIETWMSNSTKAQKFKLVSVPAQVAKCENTIDTTGYYCIKSIRDNNLQLDVNAASTANNANVQIWSATKMPWQLFRFEYVNGYYRIISAHSNKALMVQNNSLVPGANAVMYTASTADNQLWRAQKNADGSYTFFNKKNGYALYVGSVSPKAGTNVCTSGYSPTSNEQKFKLERVTNLMPTGLYNLKSALNASQVLDVTAGSGANNANIETWTNNAEIAQKWNIQAVAGKENVYTLQAVCSGKYLADNGLGNAVQVASGIDTKSQWKASIVGGSYVLTNVETGKALDVTNSKVASGTNVGTKVITNGVNQRWNLVTTAPLPNGTYIIRSRVNTSQVLEIVGSSTGNNGNVAMWKYHGGGNQKFNFTRNSDGTYTVVNCNSGKALDAAKGASSAGTNIAQFNQKNQKNQRWYLVYNSDGGFKLVSAANSQVVIGFNGSSPTNGANVCLVKDTNASSQHFKLEKTTYVPPMPAPQRDMLNKAQGYGSGTGYLIMVNRATHKVGVFKGSQGNWSYQHYWSCVTGAPGSPTITGVYRTTGYKRMSLTTDSRARWCTQISGGYFFHTILASESELGNSLSHGCVRLAIPSAQWIYNNVGRGTTVVLYN